jgi:hypothetical protein
LHIVASDQQKEEWEDFVDSEETPHNSISELVRSAVGEYIRGDDETDSPWTEEQVDAIIEYLDTVESDVRDNGQLLDKIDRQNLTEDKAEEIMTYDKSIIKNEVSTELDKFKEEIIQELQDE